MILVDTNVLLDIVTNDPMWANWSASALDQASSSGDLLINDVVYAELAARYGTMESLDEFLAAAGIQHVPLPKASLFLASKVFLKYRQSGGTRTGVLPDFFVGAHASVSGLQLLTRDLGRYATYFPDVQLITPER